MRNIFCQSTPNLQGFNMHKLIALALVAAVTCNDLAQGPEGGRKIFDEEREASPTIWKQKAEFTVNANDTEVISRVVITDRRPDKDGEAKITEGGPGQNNVTIELKSPTVFRGYDFHIEVYVVDKNQPIGPEEPFYPEEPVNTEMPSMENDTKVNSNTKAEDAPKKSNEHEVLKTMVTEKTVTDVETLDPVVQYVNENKTEALAPKSMSLTTYKNIGELSYDERFKILHPTLFSRDDDDESKDDSDEDVHSTTEMVGSTTASVSTTVGSAIEAEKSNSENSKTLGDVSKEIGERVVFGFKRV